MARPPIRFTRTDKEQLPEHIHSELIEGDLERDRGVKLRLYARKGIGEAWLVDPDAEVIEVHDLATGEKRRCVRGERAESKAIPGFTVGVARFFAV